MTSRPLRPLRPAANPDSSTTTTTSTSALSSSSSSSAASSTATPDGTGTGAPAPRRRPPPTLVACEACRRRKVRCDGQRPACEGCRRKSAACVYAVAEGGAAAPRTYVGLKAENEQLRELCALLRDLPDAEARGLFARLRAHEDPLRLIRSVQEARLLLLPSPDGPDPPPAAAADDPARVSIESLIVPDCAPGPPAP